MCLVNWYEGAVFAALLLWNKMADFPARMLTFRETYATIASIGPIQQWNRKNFF